MTLQEEEDDGEEDGEEIRQSPPPEEQTTSTQTKDGQAMPSGTHVSSSASPMEVMYSDTRSKKRLVGSSRFVCVSTG